jgi:hypothetical protein
MSLKGKVAIVIGGNSSIGMAIVLESEHIPIPSGVSFFLQDKAAA